MSKQAPLAPIVLIDALQDRIHTDLPNTRIPRSIKVYSHGSQARRTKTCEAPNYGGPPRSSGHRESGTSFAEVDAEHQPVFEE